MRYAHLVKSKAPLIVPTLLLLGALALLLFFVPRIPKGQVKDVEQIEASGSNTSDDWWSHASSVATVVGLPIAAIALAISAWEQIRISYELRRRPELDVYFARNRGKRLRISMASLPQRWRIEEGFVVRNNGTRTAHNMVVNLVVPPGMTAPGFTPAPNDPNELFWTYAVVSDLHPDRWTPFGFVAFAKELNVDYELRVSVSWDDATPQTWTLTVGAYVMGKEAAEPWPRRTVNR
jgi:hypothetical protein